MHNGAVCVTWMMGRIAAVRMTHAHYIKSYKRCRGSARNSPLCVNEMPSSITEVARVISAHVSYEAGLINCGR